MPWGRPRRKSRGREPWGREPWGQAPWSRRLAFESGTHGEAGCTSAEPGLEGTEGARGVASDLDAVEQAAVLFCSQQRPLGGLCRRLRQGAWGSPRMWLTRPVGSAATTVSSPFLRDVTELPGQCGDSVTRSLSKSTAYFTRHLGSPVLLVSRRASREAGKQACAVEGRRRSGRRRMPHWPPPPAVSRRREEPAGGGGGAGGAPRRWPGLGRPPFPPPLPIEHPQCPSPRTPLPLPRRPAPLENCSVTEEKGLLGKHCDGCGPGSRRCHGAVWRVEQNLN